LDYPRPMAEDNWLICTSNYREGAARQSPVQYTLDVVLHAPTLLNRKEYGSHPKHSISDPPSEELVLVRAANKATTGRLGNWSASYDRNVSAIAQHITQNREDAEKTWCRMRF